LTIERDKKKGSHFGIRRKGRKKLNLRGRETGTCVERSVDPSASIMRIQLEITGGKEGKKFIAVTHNYPDCLRTRERPPLNSEENRVLTHRVFAKKLFKSR